MSSVFLVIMLDTNLLLTFKDLVSLRWTFWLFVCIIQEDIGFQKLYTFRLVKALMSSCILLYKVLSFYTHLSTKFTIHILNWYFCNLTKTGSLLLMTQILQTNLRFPYSSWSSTNVGKSLFRVRQTCRLASLTLKFCSANFNLIQCWREYCCRNVV